MKHFVNMHFDLVEGKKFCLDAFPKRKHIGERYRAWIVQFPSAVAARKAVKAYQEYLTELGYSPGGTYAESSAWCDHGNYSLREITVAKLKESFLYYHKGEL